jgi:hypothetical protein
MQQSPLDIAKRLKFTSLRKIAAEVAHLNHIPVPPSFSLSELLKLFANVARPKVPDIVEIYNFGRVDWKDAGAGTFRYATLYHAKFQMNVGGQWHAGWDGWTSDMAWVTQGQLSYDTDWRVTVIAWNEWGHSDTKWTDAFNTGDNPNAPSPPPAPNPPPSHQQHPSGIQFYNCDYTPVGDNPHLPVLFHLRNVTKNGIWQFWQVDAGYDASNTCGLGSQIAPFTVPGLTAGDTYDWIVTKPDDPDCMDSSTEPTDPNHCPVLGPGTLTIGSDVVLVLQYPPV